MADAPASVGLHAQTPDVLGRLSQLLTLRGQQAQVSQEEQTARQRAAIAKYDWNKHIGEDGTLDEYSVANDPELQVVAGDQYLDVLTRVNAAKQQQLASKSTLMTLRNDQRKRFAEMMTALRSDEDVAADNEKGRQKVDEEMIRFGELYGDDVIPVLEAYAPGLRRVQKGRMRDALRAIGLQAADADRQIEMQAPQYASKGDVLTNINPLVPEGAAPDIEMELGPGFEIVTDANGRSFAINPQTNRVIPLGTGRGGRGGARPPVAGPTADPNAPTFVQPVPQQKELETHISEVRKADADYGVNRHVNDEILRLSANTSTGPGTKTWHSIIGKVAGLAGGNQVADFQKIDAYLDRQAALSAQQMGLPETNAGLQTAANLSGTTDYAPDALQTKVKLTDAMVEGAHQYRQGLDKVVGTGPNQNLSTLQQFRAQWADNFDPNVFRAERAIARGDKKELDKIREEVGSRGMAELKAKSDNLEKLARGEFLQ